MRSIFFFLLLLGGFVSAQAEPFGKNCKSVSATAGAEILGKIQHAYSAIQGLHAGFRQSSYLAALEAAEESSGQVWFEKPGKMKWLYADPEEQVFIMKDETIWLYQVADRQVLVDTLRDVLLSELPVSFLMGVGNLSRDFRLKTACVSASGYELELIPAVKKQQENETPRGLQAFRLLVDARSYLPLGARVTDVGGNVTTILLDKTDYRPELDKNTFATTFPRGVDIQDRRKEEV